MPYNESHLSGRWPGYEAPRHARLHPGKTPYGKQFAMHMARTSVRDNPVIGAGSHGCLTQFLYSDTSSSDLP
ncbi:uncharacterized protein ATNIH1004_007190 [Aspergillus tanneri]|uniref:Uncharacterized protein n=1 Tax=Aspergillus tanneri TaxID=1220188 RepID=A0A5M9MFQ5_9EURO|nr:uncharacterized protein ATNIH1004_007190 [Aspergillus tanneri]KAA8645771.1 hypothetical protein ATNIH1004_007190 [Aspergillus tanneri]